MLGANQYDLTWEHFEQLHPDKKMAFENLCRSLFKRVLCHDTVILHSDPNHPGVEVEPVLAKDGKTRISFQAKHFDNKIGYSQIEKSVNKTILYYKGKLDIIYLYCNKDIDATVASYVNIKNLLSEAGIDIVLVTGQTILDQAMSYPTVLSCYFGLDSLDDAWFLRNISLSLDNLGKRYNSLFNVNTEAQRDLSIFLCEEAGINAINAKKKNIIDELKDLRWRCESRYEKEIFALIECAKAIPDIDAKTFTEALEWRTVFDNKCKDVLDVLQNKMKSLQASLENCSVSDPKCSILRNEKFTVERIMTISQYLELSSDEESYINGKVLFMTGEMGTGKSQLLATTAKRLVEQNYPVLLLLGQTFISDDKVETQIMNSFEGLSEGQSFDALLAVLEEKSSIHNVDAVIFIDAINESRNRDVWKHGINRLIDAVEECEHVKLVISLRTGFENLTMSEKVIDRIKSKEIASIVHHGFADGSPARVYEFLSNYGIPFSPEYYLQSEMVNPLFLTWFCQTYTGEEQGLTSLIGSVLVQADKEGSKEAGFSEPIEILKPLIYEMIDASDSGTVTKQIILNLPAWSTYGVSNKIAYLKSIERAGILTSYISEQEEIFYIGYNLLEDYLRASRIIDREQSKTKIVEYSKDVLLGIDEVGNVTNFGNESVFAMVASLYAIKYGEELIDVAEYINDDWDKQRLIEQYFMSFIWRSSYISYDTFFELINKYPVGREMVWNIFIENSAKEKSELNALGLTKLLERYDLNRRDYLWTTVINEMNEEYRIISLAYYIESGNILKGLSDNKAFLLLITFTWMLSSSNRTLRDRVSKAMIEILKSHLTLCMQLLNKFKEVNDPYIIQRLYGIVFGAVMKRESEYKKEYEELAKWVYENVFNQDTVYPDILLRDYARLIVERFAFEYPDDIGEIIVEKIRPPYKSDPIPKVDEVDYGDEKYHDTCLRSLLRSMKFNMRVKGVGMYGDFGRYVYQSALNNFIGLDVANAYYYSIGYILNDLGYTTEFFGNYDSNKSDYDRHHVKKIERIGKKYQWITMYNVLARVSDVYKVKGWDWNDKTGTVYQGPWEPYVRDFDPTLNIRIKPADNVPKIDIPIYDEGSFTSIDATEKEIEKWILAEDKMFQDFPKRLIHNDEKEEEWVSLYLYQANKLQLKGEEVSVSGFQMGEQHIWSIASMYIITSSEEEITEQTLKSLNFISEFSNGTRDCYSLFSREYTWSPGYNSEFSGEYNADDNRSGVSAFPASINVLWEEGYDASQDETTSFMISAGKIIQEMGLYEKEVDGIYYYGDEIVAFDLSIMGYSHSELVLRRDILNNYLKKTGDKLFWTVIGEKQYFMGDIDQRWQRKEGYFVYGENEITGSINNVRQD